MSKCSLGSPPAGVGTPSAWLSCLVLRKNTHLLTYLLTDLRSCSSRAPEPNLLRGVSPPALNLCVLREGDDHALKGHMYDKLPIECYCPSLWMRKWKDKILQEPRWHRSLWRWAIRWSSIWYHQTNLELWLHLAPSKPHPCRLPWNVTTPHCPTPYWYFILKKYSVKLFFPTHALWQGWHFFPVPQMGNWGWREAKGSCPWRWSPQSRTPDHTALLSHLPQPWHGNRHFLNHGVQLIIIQKRSGHIPPQLHICKLVY